jgi:hypothetical protein
MGNAGSEPIVPSSILTLNLSNVIKDTSGASLTSYTATGSSPSSSDPPARRFGPSMP